LQTAFSVFFQPVSACPDTGAGSNISERATQSRQRKHSGPGQCAGEAATFVWGSLWPSPFGDQSRKCNWQSAELDPVQWSVSLAPLEALCPATRVGRVSSWRRSMQC
jgi:hypothetical protein